MVEHQNQSQPNPTQVHEQMGHPVEDLNKLIVHKLVKFPSDKFERLTTGGSMFLHAFGAYYGLAISLVMNKRDYDHPAIADLQNSRLDIQVQWEAVTSRLIILA